MGDGVKKGGERGPVRAAGEHPLDLWIGLAATALLVGLVTLPLVAAWRAIGQREAEYRMDSPEAVLESARLMVERGDAHRLPELLESSDRRMRSLYGQLGLVLGRMQELAEAVAETYPEELERLRAEAEAAALEGRAASVFGDMFAGMAPRGRGGRGARGGGGPFGGDGAAFNDALKRVFADPYGWLEEGRSRLGVVRIDDEMAAVVWDNRPIFPPFGLVMREQLDGRWQVVPPTSAPGISTFMPRTDDEYQIWGNLLGTVENVLADLTAEVRAGRHGSLDDLGRSAGEKLIIPGAMVFYAYTRAMRERGRG